MKDGYVDPDDLTWGKGCVGNGPSSSINVTSDVVKHVDASTIVCIVRDVGGGHIAPWTALVLCSKDNLRTGTSLRFLNPMLDADVGATKSA